MARKEFLVDIVKPVVEGLGYVFWGLDFLGRGKQRLLRIYIDAVAGVGVDDCATVSRQLGAVLDVEDPLEGAYILEVSSPGWDRPLFETEHFIAYTGSIIEVRLLTSFEGKRKFKGLLRSCDAGEIVIQVEDDEFTFPLELIEKANVVPQY